MTKTAEMLNKECEIDFIDINLGCPIDLVFKKVNMIILFREKRKVMHRWGISNYNIIYNNLNYNLNH